MRLVVVFILAFFAGNAYSADAADGKGYQLETIAGGLNYPWCVAFLPNGDFLLSMRSGELRRVSAEGQVGEPLANTPPTYVKSQGGYFDVMLDPGFVDNQIIYLSFAHGSKKANATRIVRARLGDTQLHDVTPIYTVEPTKDTPTHYGGRMVFLNDGTIAMTTGDGFQYREASQDPFSQLGKIIRINNDGSVPADNPFADGNKGDPYVYSLGHRSPQGLVYDAESDVLYMHEHGPKGGDEVNIVQAGKNYGWPATSHGVNYTGARVSPYKELPGIEAPIKVWTPSIAPSGLALYQGDVFPQWRGGLFVGALKFKQVHRLSLKDGKVSNEDIMFEELGVRIRDVRTGPDGLLYILTDSKKGKLIRVKP
ncbi:MAG: PQQ-dependent sugar dehydrogenase [Gammaproteobacteria bacterium]|nr:PQQ-dependent sugar dehydrogenase [Gammaproteobacteria bacterium]